MGISLWAMNNYLSDEEHPYALFDGIEFTEKLSKTDMLNYLFTLYEMNEVNIQTPSILAKRIKAWFKANYENFDRMAEVLLATYDPLENYNRTEVTTEERDSTNAYTEANKDVSSGAAVSTGTASGTSQSAGTSTVGNSTNEHQTSGDNETDYQKESKDIDSGHSDNTSNSSADSETSNTTSTSSENREGNKAGSSATDDNLERNSHVFGNIGIMTSQQMAQQTLDLYKFNLYEYIAAQFAIQFLYLVW